MSARRKIVAYARTRDSLIDADSMYIATVNRHGTRSNSMMVSEGKSYHISMSFHTLSRELASGWCCKYIRSKGV